MTDIPRLAWPLALGVNGQFAVVEQDGSSDIRQCITAIFYHRIGDRSDVPEMGVPDFTHTEQPLELAGVLAVLDRHEPRAAVLATSELDLLNSIAGEVVDLNVNWTPTQPLTDEES